MAFHDRGVVRIRNHRVLGRQLVGVADHAEQALVLRHTVDGELGVENFVAAVLAVGLREHHQLHISGVALQAREGGHEVVDFIVGQRQAKGRWLQRAPALDEQGLADALFEHRERSRYRRLRQAQQRCPLGNASGFHDCCKLDQVSFIYLHNDPL